MAITVIVTALVLLTAIDLWLAFYTRRYRVDIAPDGNPFDGKSAFAPINRWTKANYSADGQRWAAVVVAMAVLEGLTLFALVWAVAAR